MGKLNKHCAKFKQFYLKSKLAKINSYIFVLLAPYTLVMVLLIIIPLVFVVLYAVLVPTHNALNFKLSFTNFFQFFQTTPFVTGLFLAVGYACVAGVIAVIIAYPVALLIHKMKHKWWKQNMWILVIMPIWINLILRIIGLQTLFQLLFPNLLGTPIAVIIGMVYAFLPFCILPIFNSLESIDQRLLWAAQDLGASSFRSFWSITFRCSLPGVLIGFSLILIQATSSLLIVKYMGQGHVNLVSQTIQNYFFKANNFGFGAAVSICLALVVFLILIARDVCNKFLNRNLKKR